MKFGLRAIKIGHTPTKRWVVGESSSPVRVTVRAGCISRACIVMTGVHYDWSCRHNHASKVEVKQIAATADRIPQEGNGT